MWVAYKSGKITTTRDIWPEGKPPGSLVDESGVFVSSRRELPLWLAASYLGANLILSSLNLYWSNKMIETVRKRFDPPFGTKGVVKGKKKAEADGVKKEEPLIMRGVDDHDRKTVEIEGREVRSRRRG